MEESNIAAKVKKYKQERKRNEKDEILKNVQEKFFTFTASADLRKIGNIFAGNSF